MRILLTGAGGAAAISVWKSLHIMHELHMADMDACAQGLYLVPAAQRLLIPSGKNPDLIWVLLEACRQRKIDILLSIVDDELMPLAQARDQFEEIGTQIPLPPFKIIQMCLDKHALLAELSSNVPVPESIVLTPSHARLTRPFPYFAKPRSGSGSRGVFTIHTQAELDALPHDGTYLLQEFLPGDEYSVDIYVRSDGRPIAAVPRKRMKTDSGIAVVACTTNNLELIQTSLKIAQHLDLRYVSNIQFKQDVDGNFKILEINPRFSGTLPLTVAAGIDIPKLLVADLTNQPLPESMLGFSEIMVVRYLIEHFCSIKEWKTLCQL